MLTLDSVINWRGANEVSRRILTAINFIANREEIWSSRSNFITKNEFFKLNPIQVIRSKLSNPCTLIDLQKELAKHKNHFVDFINNNYIIQFCQTILQIDLTQSETLKTLPKMTIFGNVSPHNQQYSPKNSCIPKYGPNTVFGKVIKN